MKHITIMIVMVLLSLSIFSTNVPAVYGANTTLTVNNELYSQLESITPIYGSEDYQYIDVTNNGPNSATNVVVTKTVSPAFNVIEWWVSWNNSNTYIRNDPSFNPTTGNWTIGNLAVGKTAYLDLRMLLSRTGSLTNNVTARADNADPVSKAFTINVPTSPSNVDLELTNSFVNTSPTPNSLNTLTITVTRPILTNPTGIIMNDGMPRNLEINSWRVRSQTFFGGWGSWSTEPGSYDPWTGIWNVTLVNLGNMAQQLEIIFYTPSTPGTTQVISTVYGNQNDTNLANNYQTASFTVPATLNLLSSSQTRTFSAAPSTSPTVGSIQNGASVSNLNTPNQNSNSANTGTNANGILSEILITLTNILNSLLSTASSLIQAIP